MINITDEMIEVGYDLLRDELSMNGWYHHLGGNEYPDIVRIYRAMRELEPKSSPGDDHESQDA